jgi:hypothetical protein
MGQHHRRAHGDGILRWQRQLLAERRERSLARSQQHRSTTDWDGWLTGDLLEDEDDDPKQQKHGV